jgi:signal transduction histidine kinase
VSFVLDGACVLVTAGLAITALRSARRYAVGEARRIAELDAFAARVAHDLRGPLGPPLFALQRVGRELDTGSPLRPMVERGVKSLERAGTLIRDLLTFARAGAVIPDGESSSSLKCVVAEIVDEVQGEAAAARVQLDAADLPALEVDCPPGVLSSVVCNLVGNAIKYMPADAMDRRVRIRAFGTASRRVRVEVSDTGGGLPRGAQERIFDPYVRADVSRPGLGLGLATVKRLVEAHAGKVGVQSTAGRGSLFWFELPAHDAGAR